MRLVKILIPAILLLLSSIHLMAASNWIQITPDNIEKRYDWIFVEAEQSFDSSSTRFKVHVAKPFDEPPRLIIVKDNEKVAMCWLNDDNGSYIFDFWVDNDYLNESKLELYKQGKFQGKPMPSLTTYWFYLGDFAVSDSK